MDKSLNSWKKIQLNATRAVYISLRNATSYTLKRLSCEIKHGTWSCLPPEKIPPNTIAEFGTQSIGPINGTEATVFYSMEGSEEMGTFSFNWTNPFIGNRGFNAAVPNRLFSITENINSNLYSEISWIIEPRTGPKRSQTIATTSPVTVTRNATQTTTSVSKPKAEEWKQVIARSARAIVAVIDNKTRYKLTRDADQLGAGSTWALVPPESIPPNSAGQFAASARVIINGVWGKLSYSYGNNDIITIEFSYPLIGPCTFDIKATNNIEAFPDPDRANTGVVKFILQPKEKPTKGNIKGHNSGATFKLISLNTTLNETRDLQLPTRAKPLQKIFDQSEHDLLCLQGVYSKKTRETFLKELQSNFPYQAQSSSNSPMGDPKNKSDVGDGLIIFSRFPIIKCFDCPYTNCIGADINRGKGILGVKLDLSSVFPRKILYLFVTHLQSNPTTETPADIQRAITVRDQQLRTCRQFIHKCVIKDSKVNDYSDFAVLLCGDFVTTAENVIEKQEIVLDKDEENTETEEFRTNELTRIDSVNILDKVGLSSEQVIEEISRKFNENEIHIVLSIDALNMLKSFGIKNDSEIGLLRSKINSPRQRLILLIAMIGEVLESEILRYLKSLKVTSDHKKVYVNTLMIYLRLLFGSRFLEHDPIYGTEGISDTDAFWKKLWEDFISTRFSEITTEENQKKLREKVLLYKYQLIRMFEHITGIRLKSASKERMVIQEKPNFTLSDVDYSYTDGIDINNVILWEKFKEHFSTGSTNFMDELETPVSTLIKTPEYCNLLSTLMCTDVFRNKHSEKPGFTVMGKLNNLVPKKELATRVDYIFSWDYLGDENAKIKLQNLDCNFIRIKPFGETPDTQLSTHFAIEAEFSIPHS